jgi:hypothetical protein
MTISAMTGLVQLQQTAPLYDLATVVLHDDATSWNEQKAIADYFA